MHVSSKDFVIVSTTVASASIAKKMATDVVNARLAACVQELPVSSTYRWNGAVESSDEILLLIKTRKDLLEEIFAFVKSNHEYELPEMLVIDIEGGSGDYLQWITDQTIS